MRKASTQVKTEGLIYSKALLKEKMKQFGISAAELACIGEMSIGVVTFFLYQKNKDCMLSTYIELCETLGYQIVLERKGKVKPQLTDPVFIEKLNSYHKKRNDYARTSKGKQPTDRFRIRKPGEKRSYTKSTKPKIYSRKDQVRDEQKKTGVLRAPGNS